MDITTIKILVLVVVALLILATLAGELRPAAAPHARRPPHGDGPRGRRPVITAVVALACSRWCWSSRAGPAWRGLRLNSPPPQPA
jgi:hypothetical protein